jgi:hypothetical protein
MDVEVVGLGPVGLPEEGSGGIPQLGDGAAGFAAGDGPRGEGADFSVVGGNGRVEV